MKKQLSLPSAFIVFGCMIVVSSVNGRNVNNAEGPFKKEMIKKLEAERGEGPPSDLQDELLPETPEGPPAIETTPSDEVPEGCLKLDNDICLQNSEGWEKDDSCSDSLGLLGLYCWTWPKDTKRCCPMACNSIQITEEECNSYYGGGNCTYPHPSTCHSDLTTGGANANVCPEGSNILNPIECEEAAVLLNISYVGNGIWEDSTKGCLMYEIPFGHGIVVYFNSHPVGAAKNDEAPLCVKENSEIFSDLGVEENEGEVDDCTTFMISQDEGENGEAHEIRCIPEFLPCNCKNEDFKTKFNKMYLPCIEDPEELEYGMGDYGMAYLCVHNHATCMEAYNYTLEVATNYTTYIAGLCMPDEKPSNCEDGTWEELGKYTELTNYGYPTDNCTEMMMMMGPVNDGSETDEGGETEVNDATGLDNFDEDDDSAEPDVSDEDNDANEPDGSDEDDGTTEPDGSDEIDNAAELDDLEEIDGAPELDVSDEIDDALEFAD